MSAAPGNADDDEWLGELLNSSSASCMGKRDESDMWLQELLEHGRACCKARCLLVIVMFSSIVGC